MIQEKLKLTKYISEIWENEDLKKRYLPHFDDVSFLLIIGTKNRGKSYGIFKMLTEKKLKDNTNAVIVRNQQGSFKKMSSAYLSMYQQLAPNFNLKGTQEYIMNFSNKEMLVNYAYIMNYEILAGLDNNVGLVWHDEFNSATSNKATIDDADIADMIRALDTCFRKNKWRFIATGNNISENNAYFNFFKFQPQPLDESGFRWTLVEDNKGNKAIGILEYNNNLFTETLSDSQALEVVKKFAPEIYEVYFGVANYQFFNNKILNTYQYEKQHLKPYFCLYYKKLFFFLVEDKKKHIFVWLKVTKQEELDYFLKILKHEVYTTDLGDLIEKPEHKYDMEYLSKILKQAFYLAKQNKLWFTSYAIYNFMVQLSDRFFANWAMDNEFITTLKKHYV